MRITCPYCGERDLREFTCRGDAIALSRPLEGDDARAWNDHLHNRNNPAGLTRDLWYHDPCGTWIKAKRDTMTHAIEKTTAVKGSKP